MTHGTTPAVRAEGIYRSLPLGGDEVRILNGVTFDVSAGEWIALTGPSGSGKSTLLGIVSGLDRPTAGRIVIDGTDITDLDENALALIRNRSIGIVFQSFNLIGALTAQENVEAPLYAGPDHRSARERARAMLELVGLSDRRHHRPHQLSGGQQQRVAIARALVTRPALLVADEPTGNLDSTTGEQVLDLFARLREELGVTIFVATHDPDVAARADRVLHMMDGLLMSDTRTGVMS
ncbi:MAG TPA: ABC transporter ATP-binding protein [Longimicrobiales bacterium]|nr:ABC transporter ATP-binding protein [Longimicrobiales bacterium]